MKALTLHRPWAWAVIYGGKDVENRTWEPPESLIGKRIAIHAGKQWDAEGADDIEHLIGRPVGIDHPDEHPTGIIGTVLLRGFRRFDRLLLHKYSSRWFRGPVGWELTDPQPCDVIPCRGYQRLWNAPNPLSIQRRENATDGKDGDIEDVRKVFDAARERVKHLTKSERESESVTAEMMNQRFKGAQ